MTPVAQASVFAGKRNNYLDQTHTEEYITDMVLRGGPGRVPLALLGHPRSLMEQKTVGQAWKPGEQGSRRGAGESLVVPCSC